jgi:hypothetical protein
MKKLILSLAIAMSSYCSYAQNVFPTPSGNVGIGTTNPNSLLHLYSSSANSMLQLQFNAIGGGNWSLNPFISGVSNGGLSFVDILHATTPLVISNSGNVGIGTTAPSFPLELAGNMNIFPTSNYPSAATARQLTIGEASNNPQYRLALGYYQDPGTDVYTGVIQSTHGNGGNNLLLNPNGGNVGIGITNPANKLQIGNVGSYGYGGNALAMGDGSNVLAMHYGATAYLVATGNLAIGGGQNLSNQLFLSSSGKIGVGIATPSSQLDVFHNGTGSVLRVGGNAVGTANDAGVDFYANNANNVPTYARIALGLNTGTVGSETGYLNFSTINTGTLTEKMRLTAEGNVLIGQTTQINSAYKLDVNGKARANEIVVNTTGADFVFDKKYTLPKLSDVKAYIDKNQHLPEIPSAKEMQTNGMNVGEINTKLLQKVEELTLYLIDKDKQLTEQQKQIELLKQKDMQFQLQQQQIDELKTQIAQLLKQQ